MSTTLRTWLAALALGFSALVLILTAEPSSLATTLPVVFVVLFAHAWLVAVGERAGARKGGVEFPRFGLGPRLLEARPSIFPQCAVLVAVFGLASGNPVWAGLGVAGLIICFAELVRAALPILLPVGGAIAGLLTMDEFHTLGDLLVTAKGWIESALILALTTLVVCAPLMRSDAAKPPGRAGPLLVGLAGLPAYLGGLWLGCFSPWAGWQPDVYNVIVGLLFGALLQTMLIGLLLRGSGRATRRPEDLPDVAASNVGLGLMPLLLPILLAVATRYLPTGGPLAGQVPDEAWAALMSVALLVPAILAAGLVAARLDRLDGRWRTRLPEYATLGLFGAWFVFGPALVHVAAGPAGWALGLRETFAVPGAAGALTAGMNAGSAFSLGLPLETLDLWRLPAADVLRLATLLTGACAFLSTRLLSRARPELLGPGLMPTLLIFPLSVGVAWLLVPTLGAAGAMLAPLPAVAALLVYDLVRGAKLRPTAAVQEFEGYLVGEMDAAANARQVTPLDDDDLSSALPLGATTFPEEAAASFDDGWEPGQRFTPGETEADARAAAEAAEEAARASEAEADDDEVEISL